ncbi:MAG: permease [Anaerolineae bacterium]|nr:permease [Anaerolineae bacterium]
MQATGFSGRPPRRRPLGLIFSLALLIATPLLLVLKGGDFGVTAQIFATRFLSIFIEAAPFLLMGTLVSGLLEVFISREDIVRAVPKNPIAATVGGAFLGFAFPVCECGVVPVTRRLFAKGLPTSVGVAFILAAPVMNPIVLVSTFIAFRDYNDGMILIIGRFVVTAIVAIVVGVVFALTSKPHEVLLPATLAPVSGGSGQPVAPQRPGLVAGLGSALRFGVDEFFDMGRYLVIGTLLASLLQTFVDEPTLRQLGGGPVVSVIVMQLLAFILSVCSTVDSFLALSFTGAFPAGSILAFLTFGPMIDVKSTLMFSGVFRRRAVVYLI